MQFSTALGIAVVTKQSLYFTLVRSLIEYACIVWDPSGSELNNLLFKLQHRAARFVLNRYGMLDSPTSMLEILGWESLEMHRKIKCLNSFYKVYVGIGGWHGLSS